MKFKVMSFVLEKNEIKKLQNFSFEFFLLNISNVAIKNGFCMRGSVKPPLINFV